MSPLPANWGKFVLRLGRAGYKDHGATCHPSPLLPGGLLLPPPNGLCHALLSHHVLSSPPPLPPVATIPPELEARAYQLCLLFF